MRMTSGRRTGIYLRRTETEASWNRKEDSRKEDLQARKVDARRRRIRWRSGAVRHAKCLNRMETLAKMETAFAVAAAVNNSGTKREERPPSTNSNRDIAAYSGPSTKISARNKRLKTNLNSFVGSLKQVYEDEVERVKKEHENEKAALKAELQSKTEEIEALKDEVREQATKITELEATFLSMEMILVA